MIDNRFLESLAENCKDIKPFLDDPTVVEIMANPDGKLFVERYGHEQEYVKDIDRDKVLQILNLMARAHDRVANAENPIVEGVFPLGDLRFEGVLPPVARPSFSMRKKANRVFTLEDYLDQGVVTKEVFYIIRQGIIDHKNIMVVGGTSSGKTTFLNAVIHELNQIYPRERLLIIEDTQELQSTAENSVFLLTAPQAGVDMQKLAEVAMRYAPTRILVGEVRNRAALELLKLWDTGHPGGLGTFHANSASEALHRLEELVEEAGMGSKRGLIGRAVDMVLFMVKTRDNKRKLAEIVAVEGYDPKSETYSVRHLYSSPQN